MRILVPLFALLLPVAAHAEDGVTAIDDEPVSHVAAVRAAAQPRTAAEPHIAVAAAERHAPAEVGELRAARVTAPRPVAVEDGPSVSREHEVALAHTVTASATDSDLQAELALRQMKRHERALDACVAAAHKRAPALAGSVTLDFDVSDRKVRSVQLSDDSVHDAALAGCLTQAARGFSFSLAAARFRWPVALR
jgi:hypothetical protein